jgi:hypothetical protein
VVIEDHVESPGQEELYVVIAGRARITVGDEEIDAPAGTAVFVPDPETRRAGVATEDGTIVLGVGGWPGKPYHSLPWEPIFLAREPAGRGDWAGAAETLEREAGEHRDSAIVRFRLAGYYAQLGEHDRALDELTRAIEANPAFRERAQQDELLTPLREHPRWPAG